MKKRNLIKLFSFILTIILSFSLFACAVKKPIIEEDNTIKETNTYLYKDGASDFKIVISSLASSSEQVAADKLQYFFELATKIKLPIITDNGLSLNTTDKFISIGNTKLLSDKGITLDASFEDGFKLVTHGSALLIAGGRDEGIIYGMQEFLKLNLGFGFYAVDEIDYTSETSKKLLDFNYESKPDFRTRIPYMTGVHESIENENISKNTNIMRSQSTALWGLFAHTYFQILPPSTYLASHRDWYSADGRQLCHTNKEMQKEFIKQLERKIEAMPDKEYFSIGQEDGISGPAVCHCANCLASNEKYGGDSGTMMVFANEVRRQITKWCNETQNGRKVYLAVFAYQHTKFAPAKLDDKGEYTPFCPEVIAEPDLLVQFAPLEACFGHSILDPDCNATFRNALLGWQSVTKQFAIWTYSTYFTNYAMPFNNWSAIKSDYQAFKKLGAVILMDQGGAGTRGIPFDYMRSYVHSQLMWDTDLDQNELIDNFMINYYKEAYPYIRQYYEMTLAHYAEIDKTTREKTGKPFCIKVYNIYNPNIDDIQYWPKRYLDSCNTVLNKALAEVEKVTDEALKEKLNKRVTNELMSVRSLYLNFHMGSFTVEQLTEMVNQFERDAERLGVTKWNEGKQQSDKIATWRTAIAAK